MNQVPGAHADRGEDPAEEIAESVATTHERIQITKSSREYVVLMTAADVESMEATLDLIGDPDAQ